jgi:Glycoside-hydrolase family GH114
MTARFQMCKQKGFDAIEPDNIDGYENDTGFDISAQDQLSYDGWIAKEAHSVGLAVFQKNDPEQAAQLQPDFDGVLDEQCNEYSECSSFQPYLRAGKPVLNAEYNVPASQFCPADNRAGIMGALYNINLDGSTYQPCWSGSPGFGPSGGGSGWRVGIGGGTLRDAGGATAVRLTCPRGQSYCDGTVEIDVVGGTLLGRQHFHLAGGHAATVRLVLSGTSLRKLGGVSSARVTIKVDARNRAGKRASSQRTTTLRLPTAHRSPA